LCRYPRPFYPRQEIQGCPVIRVPVIRVVPLSAFNLIGAASLGTEEVGLRLLDAGADPHARGNGGETALHWAALFGELQLARRLTKGADLGLEDDQYHSTPLGWAVHGFCEPQTDNPANHGHQREVAALLVAHGAKVRPNWLQENAVRADPLMLGILQGNLK
jgi:ankyrin repeat protein